MNCQTVQEKIEDYRESALKAGERDEVEAHLSECESCRRCLGEIDLLHKRLSSALRRPLVPAGFASRVVSATASLPQPTQSFVLPAAFRYGAPLAAAAAILLCLLMNTTLPEDKPASVRQLPFFEPPADAQPAAGKPFVITASGQSPYSGKAFVQVTSPKEGAPQLLVAAFRN